MYFFRKSSLFYRFLLNLATRSVLKCIVSKTRMCAYFLLLIDYLRQSICSKSIITQTILDYISV